MTPDVVKLMTPAGENTDWERYEIESDVLTPCDAWRMVIGAPKAGWASALPQGSEVQVTVNGQLVMTGLVDATDTTATKQRSELVIQGRDKVGSLLVDNSAPLLSLQGARLDQLVKRVATAAGITDFIWLPGSGDTIPLEENEVLKVDPGMSCWDVIAKYAGRMGLGAWGDEQGRLVVGRPNYEGPPSIAFLHYLDPAKAAEITVERIAAYNSIARRYRDVYVYGQRQGSAGMSASETTYDFIGHATDSAVPYTKVLRIMDSAAKNAGRVQRRAEAEVALRKLEGLRIEVDAAGHSQKGQVFATNTLAMVTDELSGLNDTYWIYRRRFIRDRRRGSTTRMVLGPAGIWGVYGRDSVR